MTQGYRKLTWWWAANLFNIRAAIFEIMAQPVAVAGAISIRCYSCAAGPSAAAFTVTSICT